MHAHMHEQAVQLWYATKSKFSRYFDCALQKHNTGHTNMFLLKLATNECTNTSMRLKCTGCRNSSIQYKSCGAHASRDFIQSGDVSFFFPMDELVALVQTQTHSSNNRLTARDMAYYTTYGQQLNVKVFNIKTFFNVQTEPDIYSPIPIIGKLLVPSECLTTSQKKPSCLKIAPTVNAH